jgi:hypothetical protein
VNYQAFKFLLESGDHLLGWLKHVGGISHLLIILACYAGWSYNAVIEDQVETNMTHTVQINTF